MDRVPFWLTPDYKPEIIRCSTCSKFHTFGLEYKDITIAINYFIEFKPDKKIYWFDTKEDLIEFVEQNRAEIESKQGRIMPCDRKGYKKYKLLNVIKKK